MKNIIELNAEIERLYSPNIEYYHEYNNILFNGQWVNEINAIYFKDLEVRIKDKINEIPDLENSLSYKYLEVFYQDILKKYNSITNINFDNLDSVMEFFKTLPSFSDRVFKAPSESFDVIDYNPESYESVFRKMVSLYELGDYDNYIDGTSLDEIKDSIELDLIGKFGYNSFDPTIGLDLNDPNIDKSLFNDLTEEDSPAFSKLKECYMYTWLSLCLEIQMEVLKNVSVYLNYLLNFFKKFESFEADKYELKEIQDNDPNNIKLEFKINKMNVALFYRALHELGIIYVDNKNQKYQYTNLKKYLNSANIYYLENKKVERLDRINKEFSKIKDNEFKKQEINLLELLISQFQSRKADLESDKEEGIL